MFFKSVVGVFLVFAIAASAAIDDSSLNSPKVEVVVLDDIAKLKDLYPGVELIPLQGVNTKGSILYSIGGRINGDRLVSSGSDYINYGVPSNVQLTLSYPSSGVGAVITYFQCLMNQSSNLGSAYVLSGGIGQRQISVVIIAQSTTYISYSAEIYGY